MKGAWVTLATNDSYSLGALVLAHSLKQVGTTKELAILVTPGVTNSMRSRLSQVFNVVQEVNVLDSRDEANLRLLKRPELGITFTKLHCWRLTQYEKCVFLDADTLVLQNCDELFDREELSAAPDVGWPDCFNSGVFVYRPSQQTYDNLIQCALERGSFDGGDQGLLNIYFSDWAHKDISKHLPFIYNVCSTAFYSYLPAFKQFGKDVKIIHFIGNAKPWLQYFDSATKKVRPTGDVGHLGALLQKWWDIFCYMIHPNLSPEMTGLAGALAKLTLGQQRSPEQEALEDSLRRQNWEQGNIDYLGKDSFDNIWSKICETLAKGPEQVPETTPSQLKGTNKEENIVQVTTPSPIKPAGPEYLGEVKIPDAQAQHPPASPVQKEIVRESPPAKQIEEKPIKSEGLHIVPTEKTNEVVPQASESTASITQVNPPLVETENSTSKVTENAPKSNISEQKTSPQASEISCPIKPTALAQTPLPKEDPICSIPAFEKGSETKVSSELQAVVQEPSTVPQQPLDSEQKKIEPVIQPPVPSQVSKPESKDANMSVETPISALAQEKAPELKDTNVAEKAPPLEQTQGKTSEPVIASVEFNTPSPVSVRDKSPGSSDSNAALENASSVIPGEKPADSNVAVKAPAPTPFQGKSPESANLNLVEKTPSLITVQEKTDSKAPGDKESSLKENLQSTQKPVPDASIGDPQKVSKHEVLPVQTPSTEPVPSPRSTQKIDPVQVPTTAPPPTPSVGPNAPSTQTVASVQDQTPVSIPEKTPCLESKQVPSSKQEATPLSESAPASSKQDPPVQPVPPAPSSPAADVCPVVPPPRKNGGNKKQAKSKK